MRLIVLATVLLTAAGCTAPADPVGDRTPETRPVDTPLNAPGPDPEPATEASDLAGYVGLALDDARSRAEAAGRPARVVREDGVLRMVTMDFIEHRLNFTVEDGQVVGVKTDAGERAGRVD